MKPGSHHNMESRMKTSATMKGKKKSAEHTAKLRANAAARRGVPHTPEVKEKIRQSMRHYHALKSEPK